MKFPGLLPGTRRVLLCEPEYALFGDGRVRSIRLVQMDRDSTEIESYRWSFTDDSYLPQIEVLAGIERLINEQLARAGD